MNEITGPFRSVLFTQAGCASLESFKTPSTVETLNLGTRLHWLSMETEQTLVLEKHLVSIAEIQVLLSSCHLPGVVLACGKKVQDGRLTSRSPCFRKQGGGLSSPPPPNRMHTSKQTGMNHLTL